MASPVFSFRVPRGRRGGPPVYEDAGPQMQEIIKRRARQLGGVLLLPSLLDIARDLGYKSHYPVINAPDRAEYGGYPGIEENILSAATGLYVEYIVDGYVGVPKNQSPSYLDAVTPSSIEGVRSLADEIIAVHGPEVARAIASIIPQRLDSP